jgi:DNA-directed RNA polymerase subunit L
MEHPTSTEVLVRCQTTGAISAEEGMVGALLQTKEVLAHVDQSMAKAVEMYETAGGGREGRMER